MKKRFRVFGSTTPHTNSGFVDLQKSWEFEMDADDIKSAKRRMMRQARKLGHVDNSENRMTTETDDLKSEWKRYSHKQYEGTIHLKPYRYGTGGIYIQELA